MQMGAGTLGWGVAGRTRKESGTIPEQTRGHARPKALYPDGSKAARRLCSPRTLAFLGRPLLRSDRSGVSACIQARRPSFPEAPEICIEVLSVRNTTEEMDEKRRLYAAKGCRDGARSAKMARQSPGPKGWPRWGPLGGGGHNSGPAPRQDR